MTNAKVRAGANDYYDDNIDRYEEARDEEFDRQFRDMFFKDPDIITEDDVQGFIDSFDFPEEGEWLANEYESFIGDLEDQKYQAYKERDI